MSQHTTYEEVVAELARMLEAMLEVNGVLWVFGDEFSVDVDGIRLGNRLAFPANERLVRTILAHQEHWQFGIEICAVASAGNLLYCTLMLPTTAGEASEAMISGMKLAAVHPLPAVVAGDVRRHAADDWGYLRRTLAEALTSHRHPDREP